VLETEMQWDGFVGNEQVTEEENGVFLCVFVGWVCGKRRYSGDGFFFFFFFKKKIINNLKIIILIK
jgi:hypothetical protein